MPYKNGNMPKNATVWTVGMITFLQKNFYKYTNGQLAEKLGLTLTVVRTKCYEMGLKRMEMEYWTDEQTKFLLDNYGKYGDKELAEIFNTKWKKNKNWTLKHIEKKRKYLQLKRTPEQLRVIKDRAIEKGVYLDGLKRTWLQRGVSADGSIRYWKYANSERRYPVIKVDGKWTQWARYTWQKHNGSIPAGYNIVFKNNNAQDLWVDNLEMVTDAEVARRNTVMASKSLSDNYIIGILSHRDLELRDLIRNRPSIIELKRQQLLLNRTIYEQQNIS
jgi:hypothetical protein